MKVCIIASIFPPYTRGGAEFVAYGLTKVWENAEKIVITCAPYGGVQDFAGKWASENEMRVFRFTPFNLFTIFNISRYPFLLRIFWHVLDIFNLHTYLVIKRILQAEKPDIPLYTVIRTCEDKCFNDLGQTGRIVAIVGAFASGKSIVIRSLSLKLAAQGRDVFLLEHPNESAQIELQRLCRRDEDFVLVIENYSRNLPLVECFSRYARPSCTLLISERAEVHELRLPALIDRTKEHRQLIIHDIDVMDNEDDATVTYGAQASNFQQTDDVLPLAQP